jgi:hypothetical protein
MSMHSGPTAPPPPSSPQLRRYDPQRTGGGRSASPVEFEGALIDPEQTAAIKDVVSEGKRALIKAEGHRRALQTEGETDRAGRQEPAVEAARSPSTVSPEDLPPPITAVLQPEARVQALALEAKLQIAREHAPPSPSLTLEAGETVDAAEDRRAQRLQERIVSMVGLPESGPRSGVHITA